MSLPSYCINDRRQRFHLLPKFNWLTDTLFYCHFAALQTQLTNKWKMQFYFMIFFSSIPFDTSLSFRQFRRHFTDALWRMFLRSLVTYGDSALPPNLSPPLHFTFVCWLPIFKKIKSHSEWNESEMRIEQSNETNANKQLQQHQKVVIKIKKRVAG